MNCFCLLHFLICYVGFVLNCAKKGLSWINLCKNINHFLKEGVTTIFFLLNSNQCYRTDILISCLRFPAIFRKLEKPLYHYYCDKMYCMLLSATLVVCWGFFSIIRTNDRFSQIACQILYHNGSFTQLDLWKTKFMNFFFTNGYIKKKDNNVSEAHLNLKKFLIHAWLQ